MGCEVWGFGFFGGVLVGFRGKNFLQALSHDVKFKRHALDVDLLSRSLSSFLTFFLLSGKKPSPFVEREDPLLNPPHFSAGND